MTKTLEANVEADSLQPLQKLGLPQNERVLFTVVTLSQKSGKSAESCYDAGPLVAVLAACDQAPRAKRTNVAR